ncbi:MAG: CPBP family intramembrane glutamic endopeptidase [Gemmatimonadaceae bacterium]
MVAAPQSRDDTKAAFILAGIALAEGAWCYANVSVGPRRFFERTGFVNAHVPVGGWILAVIVFVAFTESACRLPSVRANLFRPSWLKLLGIIVAVTAAFCEESIFRRVLMNSVGAAGYGPAVQIAASALAFGAIHGVWGAFRGSVTAAAGATVATGLLGAALAGVYLESARVLAPCVICHFLINALAEPGLVLAAVRGEMSRARAGR